MEGMSTKSERDFPNAPLAIFPLKIFKMNGRGQLRLVGFTLLKAILISPVSTAYRKHPETELGL
jgi:hypothetical protein